MGGGIFFRTLDKVIEYDIMINNSSKEFITHKIKYCLVID